MAKNNISEILSKKEIELWEDLMDYSSNNLKGKKSIEETIKQEKKVLLKTAQSQFPNLPLDVLEKRIDQHLKEKKQILLKEIEKKSKKKKEPQKRQNKEDAKKAIGMFMRGEIKAGESIEINGVNYTIGRCN